MNLLTGSSTTSWHPVMTADTTTPSYWLNWRVLICAIWILTSMVLTFFIISKHEGSPNSRTESRDTQKERESAGVLYEDQLWKPCLRVIHPAWLLAYRLVAFFVLLIMLSLIVAVDGVSIYAFYTQWTFKVGGSLLSMYGCYKYHNKVGGDGINNLEGDAEQGTQGASEPAENTNASISAKNFGPNEVMNAGAVMLTDCVFWLIIVPFLAVKDYSPNFLMINMHSVNAFFLLGEAALNCLRFPWFRIAYFFLWTTVYVIFLWTLHLVSSTWWPYPFLDLSKSFAPPWYLLMALLHIPCFVIFAMIMKLKHFLLSRWFPQSYQFVY